MKRIQLEKGVLQILMAAVSYGSYFNLYRFNYTAWAHCSTVRKRCNGWGCSLVAIHNIGEDFCPSCAAFAIFPQMLQIFKLLLQYTKIDEVWVFSQWSYIDYKGTDFIFRVLGVCVSMVFCSLVPYSQELMWPDSELVVNHNQDSCNKNKSV